MRPEIENLLILQERDQRLATVEGELTRLPLEEEAIDQKLKAQQNRFEEIRTKAREIETNRKKFDLDVQAKQSLIAKYKGQQLQTRKNEEFSALHHEIERTQNEITALEDTELDLMGAYEEAQKKILAEQESLKSFENEAKKLKEALQKKRGTLETELINVKEQQAEAEQKIEESVLRRYRRILSSKKDVAVVPINHGSCEGCHMKLTSQTVLSAKGSETLVCCENCGRILYSSE